MISINLYSGRISLSAFKKDYILSWIKLISIFIIYNLYCKLIKIQYKILVLLTIIRLHELWIISSGLFNLRMTVSNMYCHITLIFKNLTSKYSFLCKVTMYPSNMLFPLNSSWIRLLSFITKHWRIIRRYYSLFCWP